MMLSVQLLLAVLIVRTSHIPREHRLKEFHDKCLLTVCHHSNSRQAYRLYLQYRDNSNNGDQVFPSYPRTSNSNLVCCRPCLASSRRVYPLAYSLASIPTQTTTQ